MFLKADLALNNIALYSKSLAEVMRLSEELKLEKNSLQSTYSTMTYTSFIAFLIFTIITIGSLLFISNNPHNKYKIITFAISLLILLAFIIYIMCFIPVTLLNLYDKQSLQILNDDSAVSTFNNVSDFLTNNITTLSELIDLLKSPQTLIVVTNLINIVADSKLWNNVPQQFSEFMGILTQAQDIVQNNMQLIEFIQQFDFNILKTSFNTLNTIINTTSNINISNNTFTPMNSNISSNNNISFITPASTTSQNTSTFSTSQNAPMFINTNVSSNTNQTPLTTTQTFSQIYNNIQQLSSLYKDVDLSSLIKLLNNKNILVALQTLINIIKQISNMQIYFQNWNDMQTWLTNMPNISLDISNINNVILSIPNNITNTMNNIVSNVINNTASNIASNVVNLFDFLQTASSTITNESLQQVQTISNILPLDYGLFQRLSIYVNLLAQTNYISNTSFNNMWNLAPNIQSLLTNNINNLILNNIFTIYYDINNKIILPTIDNNGNIIVPDAYNQVVQYVLNNASANTFININTNKLYDTTMNILNNSILTDRLQYVQNLYALYNNIKKLNIFANDAEILAHIQNIIYVTNKNYNDILYYQQALQNNPQINSIKQLAYSFNTTNNTYKYLYILNNI